MTNCPSILLQDTTAVAFVEPAWIDNACFQPHTLFHILQLPLGQSTEIPRTRRGRSNFLSFLSAQELPRFFFFLVQLFFRGSWARRSSCNKACLTNVFYIRASAFLRFSVASVHHRGLVAVLTHFIGQHECSSYRTFCYSAFNFASNSKSWQKGGLLSNTNLRVFDWANRNGVVLIGNFGFTLPSRLIFCRYYSQRFRRRLSKA